MFRIKFDLSEIYLPFYKGCFVQWYVFKNISMFILKGSDEGV
jgi:hypothetical protein